MNFTVKQKAGEIDIIDIYSGRNSNTKHSNASL